MCTKATQDFRLHVVIEWTQSDRINKRVGRRNTITRKNLHFRGNQKLSFRNIWISSRQFKKKIAIAKIGEAHLEHWWRPSWTDWWRSFCLCKLTLQSRWQIMTSWFSPQTVVVFPDYCVFVTDLTNWKKNPTKMAAIITNRVWRHIFKEMSKQLDPIFWQCKSENISHPKKFLVKKQEHKNKSYSAICILRNIQHVLKKKK